MLNLHASLKLLKVGQQLGIDFRPRFSHARDGVHVQRGNQGHQRVVVAQCRQALGHCCNHQSRACDNRCQARAFNEELNHANAIFLGTGQNLGRSKITVLSTR